ncbi:hypothetical protein WMO23_09550 [Megasphaera sp. CLA-AA-H81]|uniref:Uncharacterized protein n=1 Tax=Megasphaera intestinihominis TaxID=3133159 RepID=A0ABV1CXU4_9FIRM
MKARDINDWGRKPWPFETHYELLSPLSRSVSHELADTCIRIGTLLKEKFPDNDDITYEADALISAAETFEGNCCFPELTDELSDNLKFLDVHIDNLKQIDEVDLSGFIDDLTEVLQDGKDAVLFDRSRWFNDTKKGA